MIRPYLLKYPTDRGEISHAYSATLAGKDYAFKTHIQDFPTTSPTTSQSSLNLP